MAKPALGRGLGKLLKDAKGPPPSTDASEQPANLSPGMASLLRVGEEKQKPESQTADGVRPAPGAASLQNPSAHEASHTAPRSTDVGSASSSPASSASNPSDDPPRRDGLLRLSLFVADIFLAALVATLAITRKRLGWFELLLCAAALIIGAWLVWLAFWPKDEQQD